MTKTYESTLDSQMIPRGWDLRMPNVHPGAHFIENVYELRHKWNVMQSMIWRKSIWVRPEKKVLCFRWPDRPYQKGADRGLTKRRLIWGYTGRICHNPHFLMACHICHRSTTNFNELSAALLDDVRIRFGRRWLLKICKKKKSAKKNPQKKKIRKKKSAFFFYFSITFFCYMNFFPPSIWTNNEGFTI